MVFEFNKQPGALLSLLFSERPKLYIILAFLSAIGLNLRDIFFLYLLFN